MSEQNNQGNNNRGNRNNRNNRNHRRGPRNGGNTPHKNRNGNNGPASKRPPPGFAQDADTCIIADANKTNTDADSTASSTDSNSHNYCLVCYTDDLPRHRAITPCGHDDVCAQCHLRLRSLHTDRKCPVCKTVNEKLIVDVDDAAISNTDAVDESDIIHHKRFEQYGLWGDDLGANYVFKEDVGMFFPTAYYQTDVVPLFSLRCTVPQCTFTNETDSYTHQELNAKHKRPETKRLGGLKALNEHLRTKHCLTLCHLCVDNKMDFVSKLPRFTPAQLKAHQNRGDDLTRSGFKGHPLCEFCRPKRFYDLTKLHEHLNKDHYKCHVCEKQGRFNQFFKNYDKLALHFDREHFLCHEPQCLMARFVVFENEIDLRAHEISVHGESLAPGKSTKIQLEFRVRRANEPRVDPNQRVPDDQDFNYGLGGEVFVPDALPGQNQQRQMNEPEITHAAHAERTAQFRAEAARLREQNQSSGDLNGSGSGEETFPTLGEAHSAHSLSGNNLVGWTSEGRAAVVSRGGRNATAMTEDNFPSLGSANPSSSAATRAQFSAMRLAASGGGRSTAATVAAAARASSTSLATTTRAQTIVSSSVAAAPSNSRANLSSDNFPTLGGGSSGNGNSNSRSGTGASAYGLANATSYRSVGSNVNSAQKPRVAAQRAAAPNFTGDNFPTLGGGGGSIDRTAPSAPRYSAAESFARKNMKAKASQAPAISNQMDFPPPPTLTSNNKNNSKSIKQKMMEKKAPSKEVLDNILNFPPPPSASSGVSIEKGKAQVESMKVNLGPAKYKKLKSLTKDFSSNVIDAESYVDGSAALFDEGIRDESFWNFVPSLISSCPNEINSKKALKYLESLRVANQMQEEEYGGSEQGGGGGGGGGGGNNWASATGSSASVPKSGNNSHSVTAQKYNSTAYASISQNNGYAGSSTMITGYSGRNTAVGIPKKKSAWAGSGGASTKVRMKGGATSVLAAAQEKEETGTATKFMAKIKAEERKEKQIESHKKQGGGGAGTGGGNGQQQQQSKKKKTKAKNNELRALAFGGK